jgi:AraC-like DNA-binding protein
MVHLAARPRSPALQPFIKSFHYHETTFPFGLERILPSGQAHLMINLADDEFRTYSGARCERMHRVRGAALSGPRGTATVLDTGEMQSLVAVEFRPGGAAPFFPLPLDEVANQAVAVDDLWGLDGLLLREQLLEAPAPQLKLQVLESALLRHFSKAPNPLVTHAVALLSRGAAVSETCNHLGLLPKTFVRRFREQVGLTPKRFARVRRLQRIAAAVSGSQDFDWSDLALEHGFTDQAHLIHDFRDLTGITPAAYRPHSPQRRNHVPIAINVL